MTGTIIQYSIPRPFQGTFADLYKLCVLSSEDVASFNLELHKVYGMLHKYLSEALFGRS